MPAGAGSSLSDFAAPCAASKTSALYAMTIGGSAGGKHRSFRSDLDALRAAIHGIGFEGVPVFDPQQAQPLPSPPKKPRR